MLKFISCWLQVVTVENHALYYLVSIESLFFSPDCSERPLNFGIKENLTATSCYYLHKYSGTGNNLNAVRMHMRYHSPPVVTKYILILLQSAAKIFGFAIKLISTPAHSFFIDYGYSTTTNLNNPVERSNRIKYLENDSPAVSFYI